MIFDRDMTEVYKNMCLCILSKLWVRCVKTGNCNCTQLAYLDAVSKKKTVQICFKQNVVKLTLNQLNQNP